MGGGTLCPRSPSLALVLEVLEEQGAARRQGSCFTVSLPGGSPSRIVWEALERLLVGGGASASEHLPQGPEPMRAAFRILALGGTCPGRWFSLELAVPLGEALDTLHVAEALALAEVLEAAGTDAAFLWPDTLLARGSPLLGVDVEVRAGLRGARAVIAARCLRGGPEELYGGWVLVPSVLHAALLAWRAAGGRLRDLAPRLSRFDALRGRRVVVGVEGASVEGVAVGYSEAGRLVVDTGLGTVLLSAGRLLWVGPPPSEGDQEGAGHPSQLDG